jgi:Sugar (and other) transporter
LSNTNRPTARLINGFGTGQLNAIVPVWATETAEHTSRGQFIAIEFTLNIFGVVVAYVSDILRFTHCPDASTKSQGCRCAGALPGSFNRKAVLTLKTSSGSSLAFHLLIKAVPLYAGDSQLRSRLYLFSSSSVLSGSSRSRLGGLSKLGVKTRGDTS